MDFQKELAAAKEEIKGFGRAIQDTAAYQEMARTEKEYAENPEALSLMEEFQKIRGQLLQHRDTVKLAELQLAIQQNQVIMDHVKAQRQLMDVCREAAGVLSKHLQLDFAATARGGHKNCDCGCS
jgi:cell fate (sporulation/competence/biofilm development) regulator YlbF (YheA/YmcA/DUF963 family)